MSEASGSSGPAFGVADNDSSAHDSRHSFPVVVLGAATGGGEALERFFEAVDDVGAMAFVVAHHPPNRSRGDLVERLDNCCSLPVHSVHDEAALAAGGLYVVDPLAEALVRDGVLSVAPPEDRSTRSRPVDRLLESVAEHYRERAVAVILSGAGNDGSRGVNTIKERGGLVLVQAPAEANTAAMPEYAIRTRRVDLVAPAAELARRLADDLAPKTEAQPTELGDTELCQAILSVVHAATGHDLSCYKRSTLLRRLHRRCRLHQLENLKEYLDFVSDHPREAEALFDEILITVTEFFRNPEEFAMLEQRVIPDLFDTRVADRPIRVWVPGCATGEEVYSIAMLLLEEAQRREVEPEFKLFATDLSHHAIDHARRGLYSWAACSRLDPERRERFMLPRQGGWQVRDELRERTFFSVHNVLEDPPFSRQDLISCRNLAIYLDSQTHRQLYKVLRYGLQPDGWLFLGTSDFLGKSKDLFEPVAASRCLYRPHPVEKTFLPRAAMLDPFTSSYQRTPVQSPRKRQRSPRREHPRLVHYQNLARRWAPPSLLIDRDWTIVHHSGKLEPFLHPPEEGGSPDLFGQLHPELGPVVRAAVATVFQKERPATAGPVELEDAGDPREIRLRVHPVDAGRERDRGYAQIVFLLDDEPRFAPDGEPPVSIDADATKNAVVEQLEQQLEQSRRALRDTVDRYETTTEELKTSNEELLTINEELVSTSEELEANREQLQSANKELTAINEELDEKVSQLRRLYGDLRNLFSSTNVATIFLSRRLEVRRFNRPVERYFEIGEADLGRPIDEIDHRLDCSGLCDDARQVLDDLQPIEREVSAGDDTWLILQLLPYRTVDDRIDGVVVTLFDISARKKVEQQLQRSETLFRTVFEYASDAILLFGLDESGRPLPFRRVNDAACLRFGYSRALLKDMRLDEIIDLSSLAIDDYLQQLDRHGSTIQEVQFITRGGERVDEEISSRLFELFDRPTVLIVSRNITRRKAYERALVEARENAEELAELRSSFLANMSHEIRTPLTSIIGVSQLLGKSDLPPRQQQMVRLIETSGKRLHQTLDSVLHISQLEAGEVEPNCRRVELVGHVIEDIETLRPLAEERQIELRFVCPVDELPFHTEPAFLDRIVYNLVENALKFTEQGRVTVRLIPDEERVELVVEDTGIGIDEQFLPDLFDKFKQATTTNRRGFEGTGLGLALIKHLVGLLDGSISVESQIDVGTTFTVVIPDATPEFDSSRLIAEEHRDED